MSYIPTYPGIDMDENGILFTHVIHLKPDEAEFLETYRNATPEGKALMQQLTQRFAENPPRSNTQEKRP